MGRFLALVVVVGSLLFARSAAAQVHWDASAEVGAMKRFTTGGPAAAHEPTFGPMAQLAVHLALVPLVHVGAYLENDVSPVRGAGFRDVTSGGLHVKALVPVFPPKMRGWLFAGFGYAGLYQRRDLPQPGGAAGFFDIPFGIGASYKFRKPFSIVAELGGRVEAADHGTPFRGGNPEDRFGANLSIGILVEL